MMDNLYKKVAMMCSDPMLRVTPNEIRPMSWHKFLGTASQMPKRSLEEAKDLWQKEKTEVVEAKNITSEEISTFLFQDSCI